MLVRRIRNVFTGEMEKELSELSVAYFALSDTYEDLKEEVKELVK
jgi:hypothetical protein